MKLLTCSIAAVLLTASIASAEVKVTIQDGLVTVVAKDVTVRQCKRHFSVPNESIFVFPVRSIVFDDHTGEGLRLAECVDVEREWRKRKRE